MKAIFSFVAVLVLSLSMAAQSKSFYDFSVKTIDGKEYKLGKRQAAEWSEPGNCQAMD